jgi:hypothetical protein
VETSHDKGKQRHFSDIRPGDHRRRLRFWERIWGRGTVNLRPHLVRRSPLVAGIILIALLGGGFAMRKIFTRGETTDYFPATCLGTWQNPILAQGQPDTFSDATVPLDDRNSAVFLGGDQQIFCGSFLLTSMEDKGTLTSVGLTLAWRMEGAAAEPIQESPVTSSTATTTPIEVPPATTTPEAPAAFRLIPLALAQEEAPEVAPAPAEPAPTPEAVPAAENAPPGDASGSVPQTAAEEEQVVIIAPPLHADLSEDPTSTTIPTTDTSTQANVGGAPEAGSVLSGPVPDDHFLSVEYSLDGQTWIGLQKVGLENWQNFTIDLPVKSWDEMRRVQVRVIGIPNTLSQAPKMYLDGMFLEAHYEVAPILNGTAAPDSSSTIVSLDPNSSIEIPAAQIPALVPPPEIVTSTQSGDRLSIVLRYVGPFVGGNSINVFVYPSQTRARRNGSENSFTFGEEPGEGPFLDSRQLKLEDFNENKEANITLIAPGIGDEGIDVSRMVTGSYMMDIAYYDGQSWHITPAQSFTWP